MASDSSYIMTDTHIKEKEPVTEDVSLGLCVTDILYSGNTAAKCRLNYKKYFNIGIRTIRLIPDWISSGKSDYRLTSACEEQIKIAASAGLRIKLVLSTVDTPPDWVYNIKDARFVDENGRESRQNCVSYWYDGLYDYVTDAVSSKLEYLNTRGLLDYVDAVVVSCGAACEPIYPADWTQGGVSAMWCYGSNAQTDFRQFLSDKYIKVSTLNDAWGTAYGSIEEIEVPRPGQINGTAWNDVLTWYRDVKRLFVRHQTEIYKNEIQKVCGDRIKLILYMPGDAFTETDWKMAVNDSAMTSSGLMIMSENEYIVRIADEFGTYLQFTGLPMTASAKRVMNFIYSEGYEHIPVFGENTNDAGHASNPSSIVEVIKSLGMSGIDYTTSQFLFENGNYLTQANTFCSLENSIPALKEYLLSEHTETPYIISSGKADPEGDVIEYEVKSVGNASVRTRIFAGTYLVKAGDILEYDVFVPEGVSGIGQVDIKFIGCSDASQNFWINDEYGRGCADFDLSSVSGDWVHRRIYIGTYESFVPYMNTVGTTISEISLVCSGVGDEMVALFDNIRITNDGEEKFVFFMDAADLKNAVVKHYYSGNISAAVVVRKNK